jgi:predicted phosphodiesterase
MRRFLPIATSLWLLLSVDACLSTPGERAALDLAVGHEQVEDTSVDVKEGLAAIRALSEGELVLWSSAPTWQATMSVDTAGAWTVVVRNALPDATLRAEGPDGPLDVIAETGSVPTERIFRLSLPAGETQLRLVTTDESDHATFRIALMSDIQTGIDEVDDMFTAIEAEPGVRFLLGAGDLAQNGSASELRRVQGALEDFDLPYYTTLGNHDIAEKGAWHDLFGRGNLSFVFRGVRFTLLDSAAATIEPTVYGWLDDWIQRGRGMTHVVGMHIPVLDPIGTRNGGFGSRHEAGKILNRLAAGGVDLTVYGHIHSLYRFDNGGIPAIISGGGGALPERLDGVGRHFVVIDLGGNAGFVGAKVVEVDG